MYIDIITMNIILAIPCILLANIIFQELISWKKDKKNAKDDINNVKEDN